MKSGTRVVGIDCGNIIYFKTFEERELIKRFGTDYENYKYEVPILFPKFTPYNKG